MGLRIGRNGAEEPVTLEKRIPMSLSKEKRRIQRVSPDYPVVGQLPAGNVIVSDLSIVGARVDHQFPLAAGRRVRLEFSCEGEKLSIVCDITRCKLQRTNANGGVVYSSGLRFCELSEESSLSLRRVIAAFVSRHLAQRKAKRLQEGITQQQQPLTR